MGRVASAGLAVFTATRVAAAEVQAYFGLGTRHRQRVRRRVFARAARRGTPGGPLGRDGHAVRSGHRLGGRACPSSRICSRPPSAAAFVAHADGIWRHQVRFIGAGAIAVAAIWTLAKLAKPVVGGLISHDRRVARDRDRRRSRSRFVAAAGLSRSRSCASRSRRGWPWTSPRARRWPATPASLTAIALPFVLVGGFVIAAICGYMAGLIGASNSPVSGVGILSIVTCATVLVLRRASGARARGRRSSPSRSSSRPSCSRARRFRTTTCRT